MERPKPKRFAVACGIVILSSCGWAIAAHCEFNELEPRVSSTIELAVNWESVRYRNDRYEGHFEGIALEGGWSVENFRTGFSLPGYRLVRNGLPVTGIGDLAIWVQQSLWRPSSKQPPSLGARLSFFLPTGDENVDLGMGHVMLAPLVFTRFDWKRFEALVSLQYAQAMTTANGSHAHSGASHFPIVHPMSTSEFAGTAQFEYVLLSGFGLRTKLHTAKSLPSVSDNDRTFFGIGFTHHRRYATTYLEWQAPIYGSPFLSRMSGGLALGF